MTKFQPKCPDCGDTLDVYPENCKTGYCYTCHASKTVESEKNQEATK